MAAARCGQTRRTIWRHARVRSGDGWRRDAARSPRTNLSAAECCGYTPRKNLTTADGFLFSIGVKHHFLYLDQSCLELAIKLIQEFPSMVQMDQQTPCKSNVMRSVLVRPPSPGSPIPHPRAHAARSESLFEVHSLPNSSEEGTNLFNKAVRS